LKNDQIPTLDELMAKITPENQHEEIGFDTGRNKGRGGRMKFSTVAMREMDEVVEMVEERIAQIEELGCKVIDVDFFIDYEKLFRYRAIIKYIDKEDSQ